MGNGLARLTKLCRSLILKGAQCLMYTQRLDLLRFGEKTETTKVLVRADRKAVWVLVFREADGDLVLMWHDS